MNPLTRDPNDLKEWLAWRHGHPMVWTRRLARRCFPERSWPVTVAPGIVPAPRPLRCPACGEPVRFVPLPRSHAYRLVEASPQGHPHMDYCAERVRRTVRGNGIRHESRTIAGRRRAQEGSR